MAPTVNIADSVALATLHWRNSSDRRAAGRPQATPHTGVTGRVKLQPAAMAITSPLAPPIKLSACCQAVTSKPQL
ncbi:hypothetical protein E2C01_062915 [Portunus trituberculatus]|uniref:Uncharacterized protein n=1 Tax=Portunus trituberculatus TaxID=210409 RepID=A0A5B7H7U0_PORTR|nr:hypothetical protein [Portunus trituberculatus]